MNKLLIDFYKNHRSNSSNITFDEILSSDDDFWETSHDFIQWIFPLNEPSQYNPNAPLLDVEDIELFKKDFVLRKNVLLAFSRFKSFLQKEESNTKPIWLDRKHNYLRITRVIRFLSLIGFGEQAAELFYYSIKCSEMFPSAGITKENIEYWFFALSGDLDG